jgi:hypothetical protein
MTIAIRDADYRKMAYFDDYRGEIRKMKNLKKGLIFNFNNPNFHAELVDY